MIPNKLYFQKKLKYQKILMNNKKDLYGNKDNFKKI